MTSISNPPANERLLAYYAILWHEGELDHATAIKAVGDLLAELAHCKKELKAAIESGHLGHKYGCTNYTSWNDKPCSCGFAETWGWLTEEK